MMWGVTPCCSAYQICDPYEIRPLSGPFLHLLGCSFVLQDERGEPIAMGSSRGPLSGETPSVSEGGPSEATTTIGRLRAPSGIKIRIKKRPAGEDPQVSTQTTGEPPLEAVTDGGKVSRCGMRFGIRRAREAVAGSQLNDKLDAMIDPCCFYALLIHDRGRRRRGDDLCLAIHGIHWPAVDSRHFTPPGTF